MAKVVVPGDHASVPVGCSSVEDRRTRRSEDPFKCKVTSDGRSFRETAAFGSMNGSMNGEEDSGFEIEREDDSIEIRQPSDHALDRKKPDS